MSVSGSRTARKQAATAVPDAAVRLLPGVGRASMSVVTPLQGGGMSNSVFVNGVSMGTNEVYFNIVAPRFFAAHAGDHHDQAAELDKAPSRPRPCRASAEGYR